MLSELRSTPLYELVHRKMEASQTSQKPGRQPALPLVPERVCALLLAAGLASETEKKVLPSFFSWRE